MLITFIPGGKKKKKSSFHGKMVGLSVPRELDVRLLWGARGARSSSAGHAGFPSPGDSSREEGTRRGPHRQAGRARPARCHVCWGSGWGTGTRHPSGGTCCPPAPLHQPRCPEHREGGGRWRGGGRWKAKSSSPRPQGGGSTTPCSRMRWGWLHPAEPPGAEARGAGGRFLALIPGGARPSRGMAEKMEPGFTSPALVAGSSSSKGSSLSWHDAGGIF